MATRNPHPEGGILMIALAPSGCDKLTPTRVARMRCKINPDTLKRMVTIIKEDIEYHYITILGSTRADAIYNMLSTECESRSPLALKRLESGMSGGTDIIAAFLTSIPTEDVVMLIKGLAKDNDFDCQSLHEVSE